ncbi:hypothetical protein RE6C_04692 [Rhodopirellula europaea 6C]|uniref:Uncharacterized protein n=1 Tax=Rhodopirellula europaea 6C TaxID=1263867 RepID=M2ABV8_9BACT|nr:hypothetical protein RE6C_04692 [Rhodopirellula europaea 6C]
MSELRRENCLRSTHLRRRNALNAAKEKPGDVTRSTDTDET